MSQNVMLSNKLYCFFCCLCSIMRQLRLVKPISANTKSSARILAGLESRP